MKISNEVKVGAVVTAAIAALIWGINYLKGTDLFSRTHKVYAVYTNIDGLVASNRVILNGYKVGQVQRIRFMPDNSGLMVATLTLNPDIFIAKNSVARIVSSDFFGGKAIQIEMGNDPRPVEDGDTLHSELKSGIEQQLGPVKDKAENLIESLDSVATALHLLLDEKGRKNLSRSFDHLSVVLANLERTTATLDQMISSPSGSLNKTIQNVESITSTLKKNNEAMDRTLKNIASVSDSLAASSIASTINSLSKSANELNTLLAGINKGEGSLGKLARDDAFYSSLTNTAADLDKLISDLKANPKKYVHFSVFGKKN